MKEVLKFIGFFIVMILPVILIFHLFYDILNYKYTAIINNDNIEQMKEYLLLNNIEVKGELEKITIHCIDWDEEEYILTYKDNKIEEESYVFVTTEKSKKLTKYIIECSEKNDMLGLRFTLIGISIITSIVTICRLNKTETIYE